MVSNIHLLNMADRNKDRETARKWAIMAIEARLEADKALGQPPV